MTNIDRICMTCPFVDVCPKPFTSYATRCHARYAERFDAAAMCDGCDLAEDCTDPMGCYQEQRAKLEPHCAPENPALDYSDWLSEGMAAMRGVL